MLRNTRYLLLLPAIFLIALSAAGADGSLRIFVLDTEGGKAMIVMSPSGETMLVDAGYPTPEGRDTERIASLAGSLGIRQFDYILSTHYDADHAGNMPNLARRIPARIFVDHGEILPTVSARSRQAFYQPYLEFVRDQRRLSVKPGDAIPLKGVRISVLSAGGKVLEPAAAVLPKNERCAAAERPSYSDTDDNAGSIGLIYEFGKFRMADFADLLARQEYDVVCPVNQAGSVDLFMVSHHGLRMSNSAVFVHSLRPRVAIMNNGERKGGHPEVFDILESSPRLEDLWQLHFAAAAKERNAPEQFIANLSSPCEGKPIEVRVQADGSFSVTNTRNGFTKSYRPE